MANKGNICHPEGVASICTTYLDNNPFTEEHFLCHKLHYFCSRFTFDLRLLLHIPYDSKYHLKVSQNIHTTVPMRAMSTTTTTRFTVALV